MMTRDTGTMKAGFLAAVIVLVMTPWNAGAQNRMPPIAADKLTDAQKKAAVDFKAARGADVFGPFVPLLRSPDLMIRTQAVGDYLRFNSVLPPRLSEFVILLTARQWTQQYEWSVHYPIAIKAGVDRDMANAIAEGRRPEHMAEDQQILYDLCMELNRNHSVSDATYARAVAKFGEQGVIDTVGITGYYTLLAMVLNTSRTPPDPGVPTLAPFPR